MNLKKHKEDFVKSLIKSSEGQELEFKLKITSKEKIARTLSGLANSKGGIILVGLSDQGKIVGIDPEEERYMIESANNLFCLPAANLYFEVITLIDNEDDPYQPDEKNLLLVRIKKSDHIKIYVEDSIGSKKLYAREGDQTKQIK